ncbi:MAG: sulfatase-like hydrolase/transferase [Bacteroidales bacterium]
MVSDDHGKDALGCYGNPVIQTPALDRLAAEGIRFNNASG